MKITDIDKNISSCFMTLALMFLAVEPAIQEDWLSYINTGVILSLMILSFIQKNDTRRTDGNLLPATTGDDTKDNIYNVAACIAGMIISRSEESKMLYVWILLFSIYFLNILLTAYNPQHKKNKQPQQDPEILSKEHGEPEQKDKYDKGK